MQVYQVFANLDLNDNLSYGLLLVRIEGRQVFTRLKGTFELVALTLRYLRVSIKIIDP